MSYRALGVEASASASVSASDAGSAALDSSVKEAKKRKGVSEEDIEAYAQAAGAAAGAAICAAGGPILAIGCGYLGKLIGGVVAGAVIGAWNDLFGDEPVTSLISTKHDVNKYACGAMGEEVARQFATAMVALVDAYLALWPEPANTADLIKPFSYDQVVLKGQARLVGDFAADPTKKLPDGRDGGFRLLDIQISRKAWNGLVAMLRDAIQDGTYIPTQVIKGTTKIFNDDSRSLITVPETLVDYWTWQAYMGTDKPCGAAAKTEIALFQYMANAIKPGAAIVVAALIAKKTAEETKKEVDRTLGQAKDKKSAFVSFIGIQNSRLHQLDRQLEEAKKKAQEQPKPKTTFAWILGAAIVTGAILWRRR